MTIALRRIAPAELRELSRRRGGSASPEESAVVRRILEEVRHRGDAAVGEWTQRLDGIATSRTLVDRGALQAAWEATPASLRTALQTAADRLRAFHACQRDTGIRGDSSAWLRPEAVRRAGCYVPGGRAAYPSTVLMSVIPAQIAGVESIVVASPPAADGAVHPLVAAAAGMLGVGEVRAMGGAQAIAALAYGTETIERVDKIVGPGNLYVTLAKRAVFGDVGVDQVAGPSEILVIATAGADPDFVAADLVSQLEHDPLAWAVCLTDDAALAAAVGTSFTNLAGAAARSGVIAAAAGEHALLVGCDLDAARTLAEEFAPEHLSLQGAAAEALRDSVRNAGAVFCGALSPVSLGDYLAGPNHTLPTAGAARYRGPLSVMDFVRWPSVVQLSARDFDEIAPTAIALADAEGLGAHAAAIRARQTAVERAS